MSAPEQPWDRMRTMRSAVAAMAECLHKVQAHAYAKTYGVPVAEVEAEIIRNLPGGEGK